MTSEQIKKLIDLSGSGRIDQQIADRQTEVIIKGFQHLQGDKNSFLYIGDEVGLGKTYIAMGIAFLLRYTAQNKQDYRNLIFVPKKNLQEKWKKELRNFSKYNWQKGDNTDAMSNAICLEKLRINVSEDAANLIYRFSSFSLGMNDDIQKWWEAKADFIDNEDAKRLYNKILQDASLMKNSPKNKKRIKRLFAYLLNICMPKCDCLIIDEAHNFKHGIKGEVAARNDTVARMLGAFRMEEEDKDLKYYIKEIEKYYEKKVNKLLLLSATPMDRTLSEIPRQLDCFLPKHTLSKVIDEKEIENKLPTFMIRGLMSLTLNNENYSRNQYRHEHRKGNVVRTEEAIPQYLDSDLDNIIMGLVQYKTIEYLTDKAKNNASFEIGMLSGFESFATSKRNQKEQQTPTFEETNHRDAGTEAEDEHIISKLCDSYVDHFRKSLPHPKQDKLVEELFENYLKKGKKALIFVRRIATTTELERRLLEKYETWIYEKISSKFPFKSKELKTLIHDFEEKDNYENRKAVFAQLANRVQREVGQDISLEYLINQIEIIYQKEREKKNSDFARTMQEKTNRTVITNFRFMEATKKKVIKTICKKVKEENDEQEVNKPSKDADVQQQENDINGNFFFNRWFSDGLGKNFRSKTYRENWLDINYYLLNKQFNLFDDADFRLADVKKAKLLHKRFENTQVHYLEMCKKARNSKREIQYEILNKPTFINHLLGKVCKSEFEKFLKEHEQNLKQELPVLQEIIKNIFLHGSGLLPLFIAEKSKKDLSEALSDLIENEKYFPHVLREVKTILTDYALIRRVNFSDEIVANKRKITDKLTFQSPVLGKNGQNAGNLTKVATQFRMPGFPYVLVSTDILKEGEDLHTYCQSVFHYGIAWNPTDMEQRTGRIDRIGSLNHRLMHRDNKVCFENKVQVFYPYLADTLEVNQVCKVFSGMNRFIETFYTELSTGVKKESSVSLNEEVLYIPQQNTEYLKSRFEYDVFGKEKN